MASTKASARKPRTTHTPKERALAALGVAERLHAAAKKRAEAAKVAAASAEAELTAAAARLAYRKADPDLREDPQLPLEPATTTTGGKP